jgi:hypothetical protein
VPQVLKVTHGLYPLQTVTHPPPRLFIDFEALSKYLPALGSRAADAKSASNRFRGSMSVMAIFTSASCCRMADCSRYEWTRHVVPKLMRRLAELERLLVSTQAVDET